ncbi:Uu.00g094550.m01.CDS01 [Anthostomella pinea]|uniref:Uu.00g094550.m01.CDS01 n=1 Tax=Anthostomella pinea TaxID=933095 RepID=A0AAI8VNQ5_9PEZI|nr:Uu.00g094550.m01.CDS01 [Anthostomella pinea]
MQISKHCIESCELQQYDKVQEYMLKALALSPSQPDGTVTGELELDQARLHQTQTGDYDFDAKGLPRHPNAGQHGAVGDAIKRICKFVEAKDKEGSIIRPLIAGSSKAASWSSDEDEEMHDSDTDADGQTDEGMFDAPESGGSSRDRREGKGYCVK